MLGWLSSVKFSKIGSKIINVFIHELINSLPISNDQTKRHFKRPNDKIRPRRRGL